MSTLVPDGARSSRRCIAAGCANTPRGDAIICGVHAQALRPASRPRPWAVAGALDIVVEFLEAAGIQQRAALRQGLLVQIAGPHTSEAFKHLGGALVVLLDAIDADLFERPVEEVERG